MNIQEIVYLIGHSIPYPEQVRDLDLSREGEFRFTWRGKRFRVSDTLSVESVQGQFLHGCNESILLEALLKQP